MPLFKGTGKLSHATRNCLLNRMKRVKDFYQSNRLEQGSKVSDDLLETVDFLDLRKYLNEALPLRGVFLSGVYILPGDDIESYCLSSDLFSGVVNAFGFLPIGASMKGDLIAVDKITGKAYWFGIRFFIDGFGTLINLQNEEVEASRENLESISIFIGVFAEQFIVNILEKDCFRLFKVLSSS